MPSSASCPFPPDQPAALRWREVQSAYRRLCVLRASRADNGSGQIEDLQSNVVPKAVAALRESATITQAQLDDLFAAEAERVADAHALAEILRPMLVRAEFAAPPSDRRAAVGAGAVSSPIAVRPLREPATGAPSPDHVPDIADFIDEMLSQERAPRTTRRSA